MRSYLLIPVFCGLTLFASLSLVHAESYLTLLQNLEHENKEVRAKAAAELIQFSYLSKTIPALTKTLQDPDGKVRYIALGTLEHIASGLGSSQISSKEAASIVDNYTKKFAQTLSKELKSKSEPARRYAALISWIVYKYAREREKGKIIESLIQALDDREEEVRKFAAISLGSIGPPSQAAVEKLLERLGENGLRTETTLYYAASLGQIGSAKATEAAIPVLIDLIKHKDVKIRVKAMLGLQKVKPREALAEAIPLLNKRKNSPENKFEFTAATQTHAYVTGEGSF